MKRIGLVLVGVLLGAVVALQVPSLAQSSGTPGTTGTTDQRTVTVSGTATISAKPDQADVSLGVHTQAGSAQDAMDQNAAKMNAVLAALKKLGIGDADLATTNVSLDPVWSSNGNSIVGYQADNEIDVTVHDMGRVGTVIDTAVGAGANLAGGITFSLSDQNQGVNEALAKAVQDARGKADAMAAAADAQVGQVVKMEQTSNPGPQPYAERVAFGAAATAPTPVNPPTIQTDVTVSVTWALT
ncbi:MAG TPA: SIMPL domain-containing protein [Actinomycetota bacterium]|nr:SIMPL domain-containing protein [Actinomycetota bacterium]